MSKKKSTLLAIGAMMYAVARSYIEKQDKHGARILVCRVKTYMNRHGVITPILTAIGNTRHEITDQYYAFYTELEEAVSAISSKPTKNEE